MYSIVIFNLAISRAFYSAVWLLYNICVAIRDGQNAHFEDQNAHDIYDARDAHGVHA